MGNISVSLPSDGDSIEVADYNTPITTIVNTINGGLDNSNIAANAAIAGTKLADGGVTASKLNSSTFSSVEATGTSTQSISSGSPGSTVVFNTENRDALSEYNSTTGIFTASQDGIYAITTSIRWASAISTGNIAFISIDKNGTNAITNNQATVAANESQLLTGILYLSANDQISIRARQDTGGSINITKSSSYLQIARVA